MRKIFIFNRQSFSAHLFYLLVISLVFLLSGCGGGSDDSYSSAPSETGSASFTIAWHDASVIKASENSLVTTQIVPVDCGIIDKIICEVYDASNTFLTSEAFECSAGEGTIDNIPVGTNRKFVILGEDTGQNILYHGEAAGDISAGLTTDVGTINAYTFIPTLLSPDDASNVPIDNFSLNWTFVENAFEYRVLVSNDKSFANPIINEITSNTTYTPSGLSAQTTYYWKVFARDIHANEGVESLDVWSFTTQEPLDTTAPIVTITSPTSSSSYNTTNSTVDIAGTASDDVGVAQVTWSNNRGGSGICNGTTSWSAAGIELSIGTNVITVTASDTEGNTRTDTLTVDLGDTTSPIVTITSPTSSSSYNTTNSTVDIAGTASDDVGVAQVTWFNNRGESGTASGTTSWSVAGIELSIGTTVITVTASDTEGNTSTDTLTVNRGDIIVPIVTITSPTSSSSYNTNNSTVDIAGTASDNVGVTQVTWSNNQGGNGTASGTTLWSATGIRLAIGTNVITVTASDAAGNTSTDTLTVNRGDIIVPIVTITSPTSSSSYNTTDDTVNIAGTASDNVGVAQVTWSNSQGGSGTCSGTTSWSAGGIDLFDGTNVITVTASDTEGNTGTDTLTVNKLVPEPPVISTISYNITGTSDSCINASGGTFTGTTYNIRFNYSDPDGDVTESAGAKVWAGFNSTNPTFDATYFSTFSGDGFTGSITSYLCTENLTSINVTLQLQDGDGELSNKLTTTVVNP